MRTFRLALILVVSGIAAIGSADVAFNNFGSGDSFYSANGWTIGGSGDQWIAMNFTSATSGSVSKIVLGLYAGANYNISINSDAGGMPGGALEEHDGVAGADGADGVTTTVAGGGANLVAGTQYWVVLLPSDSNQSGAWAWANTDTGNFDYAEGGGGWNTYSYSRSAFRVETNAVPEPTSMAALGLGALALAARRRRKA